MMPNSERRPHRFSPHTSHLENLATGSDRSCLPLCVDRKRHQLWLRNGDIDPVGGGTVKLTPDHRTPHALHPEQILTTHPSGNHFAVVIKS